MKPRAFFIQASIALLLIVLYNVAITLLARQMPARKMIDAVRHLEPGALFIHGNSTMDAAFNDAIFAKATGEKPFRAALGATLPVDHLNLARLAFNSGKPRAMLYGFYGFQLYEDPTNSWRQFSGNRCLSLLIDPATAIRYSASNSIVDHLMIRLAAALPALRERDVIWFKVEKLRRALADVGLPSTAANKFGRVADFKQLVLFTPQDVHRLSQSIISSDRPFCGPLVEMFDLAKNAGVEVTVVAMPSHPTNLPLEVRSDWNAYIAHVTKKLRQQGIRLIDATDWISEEKLFEDVLHVNEAGAVRFTEKLAQQWPVSRARP